MARTILLFHIITASPSKLDLGFAWVVAVTVGWVGVWGVWAGPGLVWMGCVVFAVVLL